MVQHTGPVGESNRPERMDLLWVHSMGRDLERDSGWGACRLHAVGSLPDADDSAYGFLDPQEAVRGVHLIPAFT